MGVGVQNGQRNARKPAASANIHHALTVQWAQDGGQTGRMQEVTFRGVLHIFSGYHVDLRIPNGQFGR